MRTTKTRLRPTTIKTVHPKTMRTLDESENFILGHEYEDVFLLDKQKNKKLFLGSHYGDPTCGLIDPDEKWFISAGEGVLYFDFAAGSREFLRGGFINNSSEHQSAFVHALRSIDKNAVEILLDPWSDYASVWVLDIEKLKISKLKDGPSKIGEEYSDKINW